MSESGEQKAQGFDDGERTDAERLAGEQEMVDQERAANLKKVREHEQNFKDEVDQKRLEQLRDILNEQTIADINGLSEQERQLLVKFLSKEDYET